MRLTASGTAAAGSDRKLSRDRQLRFTSRHLGLHLALSRWCNVRRVRTAAWRLFIAYMALQVLSGWVIMFAIGWCLIEIVRGPERSREQDVEFWLAVG